MTNQQGRNIAIVGASGTIGKPTLSALLKSGLHTITVITRAESTATFPTGVHVRKGDYNDESFLISALQSQEVLILQLSAQSLDAQTQLINAGAKAGVSWILPTEFGSDFTSSLADLLPMIGGKKKYRDQIEELGLSWIGVVNNLWFDWTLGRGFWNIDIKTKKATLYDGGETKLNTTTLAQAARGVAALLSLSDEELQRYKNQAVYLSSFCASQREVLESILQATGAKESDWEVNIMDAEEAISDARKEVANGNFMAGLREFFVQHVREGLGGNYQPKATKDMEILGLEEEDLHAIVKDIVAGL